MHVLVAASLLIVSLFVSNVDCACKEELSAAEQALLDLHNNYRRLHKDTADLCYGSSGDKVKYSSATWSATLAAKGRLEYSSDNTGYGENVFVHTASNASQGSDTFAFQSTTYTEAVDMWYNEIAIWDFATSAKTGPGSAGHFTQIVWAATTEVNCGIGRNVSAGSAYVVCQYYPAGNYLSEYPANVLPLNSGQVSRASVFVIVLSAFISYYSN